VQATDPVSFNQKTMILKTGGLVTGIQEYSIEENKKYSLKSFSSIFLLPLLLRKEVIHPLLPERIPCYDLVLVAGFTFHQLSWRSGAPNFINLTGGLSFIEVIARSHPASGFPAPGEPQDSSSTLIVGFS
jgi:hypothetical protein